MCYSVQFTVLKERWLGPVCFPHILFCRTDGSHPVGKKQLNVSLNILPSSTADGCTDDDDDDVTRHFCTCFPVYNFFTHTICRYVYNICRVQLKCDGTRWRAGGEVKGKLANGLGSQYSSGNMVYPTLLPLLRTPRLPVVDWTDAPCQFKWTRPFHRKTISGFCVCVCAVTFQTQSIASHMPSSSDPSDVRITLTVHVPAIVSFITLHYTWS